MRTHLLQRKHGKGLAGNRHWIFVILGLYAIFTTGCTHSTKMTSAQAIAMIPATLGTTAYTTTRYPGAGAILTGFDLASESGQWRSGDRVLIGLSFEKGGQKTDRMLLVDLLDKPGSRPKYHQRVGVYGDWLTIESPTRATRLRVFDAQGTLLSDTTSQLAEIFLDYGPAEVARLGGGYGIETNASRKKPAKNPHPEIDMKTLTPGVYGMMSLLAFGEGAGKNPTLESLISKAFTARQIFGLFFSFGRFQIRIGESSPLDEAALSKLQTGPGLHQAYQSEIRVSIGSHEALAGRAVLAPTRAPLGLCGGIVSGHLTNLANPEIHAQIFLLAAQRGTIDTNNIETIHTFVQ